jgi:[ribosomal protein S5]-alanine N-acetyltransferase
MTTPADRSPVELVTGRLVLRMAAHADVPAILRYYRDNHDFLAPFEPRRHPDFLDHDFWVRQVDTNREEFRRDRSLRLFLFDRGSTGTVTGTANFTQFVRGAFHACNLGYSLSQAAQGKGLMREALDAAVRFVFDDLRLHRVQANYMPHNRRSGATLRALGFVVEGYARDYLMINGRWEDHVLTSLTNPEWSPPGAGAGKKG